jgi:UDP-glucose 4-epimerase
MKIIITGGDGFIGSHMVEVMLNEGHSVRVVENKPRTKSRRLASLLSYIDWFEADCCDFHSLKNAFQGGDVVYHFASSTNQTTSWDDPVREVSEGILPAVVSMEAAATTGVSRFALASSAGAIYGLTSHLANEETRLNPFTPYGIGKQSIELFAGAIAARTGMNVDLYRISNPYGPNQATNTCQGVVAIWMRQIREGQMLRVYGDDRHKRDYIFVKDACRLMARSASRFDGSQVYNICSGNNISILDLLELFRKVIPAGFQYTVCNSRPFDNMATILDNTRNMQDFEGFQFLPIEDGLRETWRWHCLQSQFA